MAQSHCNSCLGQFISLDHGEVQLPRVKDDASLVKSNPSLCQEFTKGKWRVRRRLISSSLGCIPVRVEIKILRFWRHKAISFGRVSLEGRHRWEEKLPVISPQRMRTRSPEGQQRSSACKSAEQDDCGVVFSNQWSGSHVSWS